MGERLEAGSWLALSCMVSSHFCSQNDQTFHMQFIEKIMGINSITVKSNLYTTDSCFIFGSIQNEDHSPGMKPNGGNRHRTGEETSISASHECTLKRHLINQYFLWYFISKIPMDQGMRERKLSGEKSLLCESRGIQQVSHYHECSQGILLQHL